MVNMMKADFYRLSRQKGIYIALGVVSFFIISQVIFELVVTVGIKADAIPSTSFTGLTGVKAVFASMTAVDNFLYYLLPFVILIVGADFSSGAIKNVISSGASRVKYYFSKLILVFICVGAILFLNVLLSFLAGTIINGVGESWNKELLGNFFRVFLPQLYILLGVSSVATFLVFISKKTSVAISSYLAFCIIPTVAITIFSQISEEVLKLLNYDLVMNLKILSLNINGNEYITRAFWMGTVYLIVTIIASLFFFKKCEIK